MVLKSESGRTVKGNGGERKFAQARTVFGSLGDVLSLVMC